MKRHVHADLIKQWADGYHIQKLMVLCCDRKVRHWEDMGETTPMWIEDQEYRVKPEVAEYPEYKFI